MWCGLWFDLIEMGGCLVCWLECLIPGALMVGVVVVVAVGLFRSLVAWFGLYLDISFVVGLCIGIL